MLSLAAVFRTTFLKVLKRAIIPFCNCPQNTLLKRRSRIIIANSCTLVESVVIITCNCTHTTLLQGGYASTQLKSGYAIIRDYSSTQSILVSSGSAIFIACSCPQTKVLRRKSYNS